MAKISPIRRLLKIMADLRSPQGCPWDREQDHQSLRRHAIEEIYELIDAIESRDDTELEEELGDVLLQVVFHCQLAQERNVFDFDQVCQTLSDKLVRRHPHVFGDAKVKDVDAVWRQWEAIKREEKSGTRHERPSVLDGIPKHLPSLLKSEKLIKKARKAKLTEAPKVPAKLTRKALGEALFDLAAHAQEKGWSAEMLLRETNQRKEKQWRKLEG